MKTRHRYHMRYHSVQNTNLVLYSDLRVGTAIKTFKKVYKTTLYFKQTIHGRLQRRIEAPSDRRKQTF